MGRDADLEQLRAVIARPGVRLVTLTGTGGVGKTRLALAAASSLGNAFRHGVFFIALAAVSDADVMWKTIADGLDVVGDGSAADAVTGHLGDRQALLVLDNLEQLERRARGSRHAACRRVPAGGAGDIPAAAASSGGA